MEQIGKIDFFKVFTKYKKGEWFCFGGQPTDKNKWITFMKMALSQYPDNFRFFKYYTIMEGKFGGLWIMATNAIDRLNSMAENPDIPKWIKDYNITKDSVSLVGEPIYPPDPNILLK